MALTLIHNPREWSHYVNQMANQQGIPPSQVSWGSGPAQYPCLVASKFDSPMQITSCYVYMDDARRLLRSAGITLSDEVQANRDQEVQPGRNIPVPVVENNDFHRHTAAMLLAIVEELIEVKITTKERFEMLLARKMADVDRWHEEDKNQLVGASGDILRRLFQVGEEDGSQE